MTATSTPSGPLPGRGSRMRRHLALVAVVGLGLFGLLYVTALLIVGPGVPRGTTVAGVSIGGLAPEAAVRVLETELRQEAARLRVMVDGSEHVVRAQRAGLRFDAEATVAAAGERDLRPWALARQLLGGQADPVVRVDDERLANQLDRFARQVDDSVREGKVVYDGTTPVGVTPQSGRTLDRAAAAEAVKAGYLVRADPVALPVVPVEPTVTADQVQAVVDGPAVTAVSAPVVLEIAGSEVVVTPEELAASLSFVADGGQLVPKVSVHRLRESIGARLDALEEPAQDAAFDVSSGTPVVVPSRTGRGVSDADLARAVISAASEPTDRTVQVSLSPLVPDLTTREARGLGITEPISTFTQWFPYAAYRVTNIGVAASKIDGTVLRPGDTFSLNGIVGERTPENGFVKGYVIYGNRLVEDYGGAVSTMTTATWHAAFFAGMTRIEQRAHGFWISRYVPGLEATVYWGDLDLKFRNDTPYGVLVTTSMTNESVTVTMWSTKYWTIKAESGPRTDIRPSTTVYDTGSGCVPQEGVDGFDITVTRVWIRDGEVKRREPLLTSYEPAPTVICSAKPKSAPSPSASPGPSGSTKPSPKPSPEATST